MTSGNSSANPVPCANVLPGGFSFVSEAVDGNARAGTLVTPHGTVTTPVFMPVGTQATVKGVAREQIFSIGTEIMLSNTYHLHLRPGEKAIAHFGGLHGFMNVNLPILTDSGGFQVFSLGLGKKAADGQPLAKVTEEGVEFRSHLDGSKRFFTPEKSIEIQSELGADIIMAFDECAPGTSDKAYARAAMERTHRWAERSLAENVRQNARRKSEGLFEQAMFPIAQGVVYPDLRVESVRFAASLPTVGMAIGGLSVGETKEEMLEVLDAIAPHLPAGKPRYLMGVGTPEDLVEGIYRGIDMFDCVLPTRLGRHEVAMSSYGNVKVTNEKYALEKRGIPMLPEFETHVSKTYSLGYLRHLLKSGELLGGQLLSLHNLEYLIKLAKKAREAILAGEYEAFRKGFWNAYGGGFPY
ncbi:MAG: queuine tRNA-ribosyltransferase, partial [Patescibacteria group bacterium]|nr:queuine tRNA-ribosyltransferase [Patescibacteria group bacterium]